MIAGTPVIDKDGDIGIVTDDINRNGNVGVIFVGARYSVRHAAEELTPVSIQLAGPVA